MLKSRGEAKSLRELLSYTKKKESDPLLDDLLAFKDRMGKAAELLKDEALTAFFFRHAAREPPHRRHHPLHQLVHEFGIPVGASSSTA